MPCVSLDDMRIVTTFGEYVLQQCPAALVYISLPSDNPSPSSIMSFPFVRLPVELGLEILRVAASPAHRAGQSSAYQVYATARALASVSHSVRQVVMPNLLHTVMLNSHESLTKFIRTLQQQKWLAGTSSRLKLDYSNLVRRFWCSRCWEPMLHENPLPNQIDLLREVFRNAETLGFTFISHHLLIETLGGPYGPDAQHWNCKHLTMAGINPRWNWITSSPQGQAFLRQLTHLTLWLPSLPRAQQLPRDLRPQAPGWIQRVPFEYMPNLTQFAFQLIGTPRTTTTSPIVVYTKPPHLRQQQSSVIFRTWAMSADPISHGKIVHVNIELTQFPDVDDANWGMALLDGRLGGILKL